MTLQKIILFRLTTVLIVNYKKWSTVDNSLRCYAHPVNIITLVAK